MNINPNDRILLKDKNGKIFRALVTSISDDSFIAEWVSVKYDFNLLKDTLVDCKATFNAPDFSNSNYNYIGKP